MPKIIRILRSCSMKIFSKFPTVNISKLNFWLVICIAKNFIWTTLKVIFSIFRFFCTLRFQISKYCPIITNHTSMESSFISALRWCINLNFKKFTLMTGFVVQGHTCIFSVYTVYTVQIVSQQLHNSIKIHILLYSSSNKSIVSFYSSSQFSIDPVQLHNCVKWISHMYCIYSVCAYACTVCASAITNSCSSLLSEQAEDTREQCFTSVCSLVCTWLIILCLCVQLLWTVFKDVFAFVRCVWCFVCCVFCV